jgi:membrane fusion protein (multidrug efflux system)
MAEISRTSGRVVTFTASGAVILASLVWTACSTANGKTEDRAASALAVSVSPVAVTEQPISRFIRVTGTLTAEEQADVAAETSGRVISTPVERGSPVTEGTELVRLSAVETEASVKEAEANAAQIEARLAQPANGSFDVNRVPEVANARANFALAESEFSRIEKLLAERVVSQSEYDQRKTQVEAARQLLESAKNGAEQQYQALQAARARVTLARKAASDTVVRAPFSGVVVERLVSTGDYVTRGTKVAQVVRIMPLRIALTVPEQFVADVKVGQPVSFSVDAFSGRAFEGRVRYVSPSLRAEQRALTVEAVVPNSNGELKPGMFATALIQQPNKVQAVLVPTASVRVVSGTSRVFVIAGDRAEERLVTTGQVLDQLVEITAGLSPGEKVATANVPQLVDGVKVR